MRGKLAACMVSQKTIDEPYERARSDPWQALLDRRSLGMCRRPFVPKPHNCDPGGTPQKKKITKQVYPRWGYSLLNVDRGTHRVWPGGLSRVSPGGLSPLPAPSLCRKASATPTRELPVGFYDSLAGMRHCINYSPNTPDLPQATTPKNRKTTNLNCKIFRNNA